jgi:hypothetical protein
MKTFLRNFLGPIWLLVVVSYYLKYHANFSYSLNALEGTITLTIVWLILFSIIGVTLYLNKRKHLIITPLKALVGVLLLSVITGATLYGYMNPGTFAEPYQLVPFDEGQFAVLEEGAELNEGYVVMAKRGTIFRNWDYFQETLPAEMLPLFKTESLSSFTGTLTANLLKIIGSWLFFTLLFHNLGAVILRRKEIKTFGFFKNIGLGMAVFMGLMFLLGTVGLLKVSVLWVVTILALIAGATKLPLLLQTLKNAHFKISLKKENWWVPLVLLLSGIPMALNIIETIKPYPGGFDSLVRYHNTPNLLAQYEGLVAHLPAYNYELIFGLGRILFNSTMIGAGLSLLGAFLGFGLLFTLLNKKFRWQESFLLMAIFLSLPMTQFMLSVEPKIDLPLLFFSLLAVYEAIKSRYAWAGFWLGICLGIKATTVLLMFTLLAYFAFNFWGVLAAAGTTVFALGLLNGVGQLFFLRFLEHNLQTGLTIGLLVLSLGMFLTVFYKKKPTTKQVKSLFLMGGIMMLTFSPWVVKGVVDNDSFSANAIMHGGNSDLQQEIMASGTLDTCHVAEHGNEIDRYSGYFEGHDIFLPLVMLWDSTINSGQPNNRISNIGFLFLGFAVFGIFAFQEAKRKDPEYKKITLFTLLYILLWLVSAEGIVWYGLPLFAGLLFVYGGIWRTEKWPYIVIIIWLVMSFSLRIYETERDSKNLFYAGGLYDDAIYYESANSGAEEMAAILNAEENLSKNIYQVSGVMNYFVKHNDKRVYRDFLLDNFYCYFYDEDPEVVIQRLRAVNIEYVFFAPGEVDYERDTQNVLKEQKEWFDNFAANYLEREVYRAEMSLYSVPSL